MQFDFTDQRILITGACGSIGGELARALSGWGADLILLDLSSADFNQLLGTLPGSGRVDILGTDLGVEESYLDSVTQLLKDGLNGLVNNAAFVGTSGLPGWAVPFEDQTGDAWRKALEVNLVAPFKLSQACAPALSLNGKGSIVNIGSIYATSGQIPELYEGTDIYNPAAYGASKGGLIQLTRWLATTMAPDVRVNAVSPGGLFRNQDPRFVERYCKRVPLRRMALEKDLIGLIALLLSAHSGYITGQNIMVDGGWSAW